MVFNFKGIPKIKIPVELSELNSLDEEKKVLDKYLSLCLKQHNANAEKIKYLYEFYLGMQDISTKVRQYKEDSKAVNNKDVENHAYAQVEFKKALCDTLQYTHKDGVEQTDDLAALGRILTDVDFDSKHQEVLEYMFSTGVGTTFSIPKTDIIKESGIYSEDFKVDYQSPFIFETVNPCFNFNIYSSYIGEEPLFSVCIVDKSDISIDNINGLSSIVKKYQIVIYSRNFYFKYIAGIGYNSLKLENEPVAVAFHFLPLIEYSFNKSRLGIVEINRDEYNVMNLIISNSADAVVDTVNQVIVFENVDIGEDQMNEMLSNGAIKIKSDTSSGMTVGSKVYTLELKFNHTDINIYYEQRLVNSYMIVGCVRAVSNTNSGGTTQGGSQTANGWDNAWLIIKKDIKSIRRYDYAQLKLFLEMVKLVPNTTIKDISASEIEIKYNLNPNDNILSKAQSLKYFDEMNMPEEMALQKSGLSMDINEEAKKWRDNKKEFAEKYIDTSNKSTSINGNAAV